VSTAAGRTPVLRVEGVDITHGGVPAVTGLSLEVSRGEIVALLGRNGAGKTTTLRAIAGLHRVAAGTIHLDNLAVHNRPAHAVAAAGCTLVQDGNRIFRRLPVTTNLRLGGFRVSRTEVERRIDEQLRRFPVLAGKRDVAAGQLSGGEQQQLALAQGLMAAPQLLMLDEPSVGLAIGLVRNLFALLATLRDDGMAVLIAEQSVDQVLRVADRAYVLDVGCLVASGPAPQVRDDTELRDAYLGKARSWEEVDGDA
jgi:ABC-type branched-subunit amino acid transport system ATPase component